MDVQFFLKTKQMRLYVLLAGLLAVAALCTVAILWLPSGTSSSVSKAEDIQFIPMTDEDVDERRTCSQICQSLVSNGGQWSCSRDLMYMQKETTNQVVAQLANDCEAGKTVSTKDGNSRTLCVPKTFTPTRRVDQVPLLECPQWIGGNPPVTSVIFPSVAATQKNETVCSNCLSEVCDNSASVCELPARNDTAFRAYLLCPCVSR